MVSKGFFAASELVGRAPSSTIPKCGKCGLFKQCKSPKLFSQGKGRKGILIVGRPPNAAEDASGILGGGRAGHSLQKALEKSGVHLREDCWVAGALACWPGKREIPTSEQISHCRPTVLKAIREHKPRLIIVLGPEALNSVLSDAWKPGTYDIKTFSGYQIPSVKYNAWICPMDHPDFVFNSDKNQNSELSQRRWAVDLRKAVQLKSAPWVQAAPDYENLVECIYDTKQAAKILRDFIRKPGPIAFDYETNCLHPEYPKSRLVSCSVCWKGERTIAFPIDGFVIPALRDLLRSPCPKIAANMKFEDRWTRNKLKTAVRNWIWDTMLASHWEDSRGGIAGLKLQAFLHLGIPSFNENIEPYLKSVGETPYNRIDQISTSDLLRYNGMDSLIEYRLAEHQIQVGRVSNHLPML